MSIIPKNPVSMRGTITECLLFAYQMPEAEARQFLPRQLEAVTYNGCAFWNIVVCKVKSMRPLFFPENFGVTYWHVAYRIYVRFCPRDGQPIEGLYFVRSDCDNPLLSAAGNFLTDFNFHVAQVHKSESADTVSIQVVSGDMPGAATISKTERVQLPTGSCFSSLDEAAQFLKYKSNGISVGPGGQASIVHIERDEPKWQYQLMTVMEDKWSFFSDKAAQLEVCYQIQPIDYLWRRAKVYL